MVLPSIFQTLKYLIFQENDLHIICLFVYFSTGLLSMALALLELALEIRLELTEILLTLPPEC